MERDAKTLRAKNEDRCRRILDMSTPLVYDDLDWHLVGAHELDPSVIESLVYMRDVEGFTDRDLVGLTAHRTTLGDPIIRRFLGIWRSEETVHSQVLDRFLRTYGEARGIEIPPRQMPPPAEAPRRERLLAMVGGTFGHVVVSAHMAWGAANELLTLNGYRLLAARCEHPVLVELLDRIAVQESRHYSFYLLQAEWRLAASGTARRALRWILGKAWTPVGIGDGYKTWDEFGRVLAYLGRDDAGRRTIARMDRRFAALPGFDDLEIYRRATESVALAA